MTDNAKPRHSKKRRRNKKLVTRVDDAELAAAVQRAKSAGLAMAAYVRAAVCGSAGENFQRRPEPGRELLIHSLADLGRLNQRADRLVRLAQAGQADAGLPEFSKDYAAARDLLITALRQIQDGHRSDSPQPPPGAAAP